MKIGIYGGSFNPPHLGHLAAARTAVKALGLDLLQVVPAGVPPHKALPEHTPDKGHRKAMAEIFADQIGPFAQCWDVELERPGRSFTADTLQAAAVRWPEAELYLLMGADMFLSFQSWYQPEEVARRARIVTFGRTGQRQELEQLQAHKELLDKAYGIDCTILTIPDGVDVSSTQLRQALPKGEGRQWLPKAVYGYLVREGLYGLHADLRHLDDETLRCVSYSMVRAKRLPHIRGTEQEAVRLAQRWGADVEEMRRAAILHDCTKYESVERHLAICAQYGIELDEMERSGEKLLHAKSGAALAKYVFGESQRVFEAILYHTTGRGDMTLEEKLLYLADYIEPCRDFPEVEEMRRLAYTDLDRAVLMGVELSIQEMVERNRVVHPNTLDAEKSLRRGA